MSFHTTISFICVLLDFCLLLESIRGGIHLVNLKLTPEVKTLTVKKRPGNWKLVTFKIIKDKHFFEIVNF
jgi:hypothetical protein